jgi:rhomboid family GlyGly-CTERM serine protease
VLAEAFGDSGRLWLRYQRDGLADGEFWRLVTGHLVHLGPSHMVMNIAALAILALLFVPLLRPLDWLWVCLVSALAIDAGLYWLSPEIVWYVGLSGVLHGCWAGAAIRAWALDTRQAVALTGMILLKLGFEAVYGPLGITGAVAAGPVVSVAHAYGAAGGTLWALTRFAIRSLK